MKFPSFQAALDAHDVEIPQELIAREPASPRDSAGLVVLDRATGKTEWAVFSRIGEFLPRNCVLVLNETRVIPARLVLTRWSGGRVRALWTATEGGVIRVMADRRLKEGERLTTADGDAFVVTAQKGRFWLLRPEFPIEQLRDVLERCGTMPLPPYIKDSPLTEARLREEYQAVFAKEEGSVAAPTASLHFTPELVAALRASGVRIATVTLHVHLGTFAPLTEEQWESGCLHAESYRVPPESARLLEEAKAAGDPIVAVGTTALRTLESAADDHGKIVRPEGATTLFIREGYAFRMVDSLITNFHVPRSSLLMLACAFGGRERVLEIYREAVAREWRFFSFGDAMLIR